MSFLNFFIPYSYFLQFEEENKVIQYPINVFVIYLDNPKNNIYFPFQKTGSIDFNTLKSVISNLNILLLSPVSCIFLNYNKVNCNIDFSDFIIKTLDNYMTSPNKCINQEIDSTILEKPVLIKLGDNKYFFDFKINQRFIDSSILVDLFKMYKFSEPYNFMEHSSFFRPFFNCTHGSGKWFHLDPSYAEESETDVFGIFIIGINPNINILELDNNNSWILANYEWINPYLKSFCDEKGDLYCNKYLNCSDTNHTYSCKILSNCIYSNKKLLFGHSLPFWSVIEDYENLFTFLNSSRNCIDIINLNNEKINEDWLKSKLSLIIDKFSVNIDKIPINIWLNNYSELNHLNSDLIKEYNIKFLNWSFYKFLFFSNSNSIILGSYRDHILKNDSNLREVYFNKVD